MLLVNLSTNSIRRFRMQSVLTPNPIRLIRPIDWCPMILIDTLAEDRRAFFWLCVFEAILVKFSNRTGWTRSVYRKIRGQQIKLQFHNERPVNNWQPDDAIGSNHQTNISDAINIRGGYPNDSLSIHLCLRPEKFRKFAKNANYEGNFRKLP